MEEVEKRSGEEGEEKGECECECEPLDSSARTKISALGAQVFDLCIRDDCAPQHRRSDGMGVSTSITAPRGNGKQGCTHGKKEERGENNK